MAGAAAAEATGASVAPPSGLFRKVGLDVFKLHSDAVAAKKTSAARETATRESHGSAAQAASGAGAGESPLLRLENLRSRIGDLRNAIKEGRACSSLAEPVNDLATAVREVEKIELTWGHWEVARYAAKVVRDFELCMLVSPSVEYAVCMVGAAELVVKPHSPKDAGAEARQLNAVTIEGDAEQSSDLGRATCAFMWSLYGALQIEPSDFQGEEILGLLPHLVTRVLRGLPSESLAMRPVWVEELSVSVATYVVLLRASNDESVLYCDDLGDGGEKGPLALRGENISRSSTDYGVPDLVWIHASIQLLVEVKVGFGVPEEFYFPTGKTSCTRTKPSEAVELVYWSQLCPYVKAWLDKTSPGSYSSMHGLVLMGCVPEKKPWCQSWVESHIWPELNGEAYEVALDEAARKYFKRERRETDTLQALYAAAEHQWRWRRGKDRGRDTLRLKHKESTTRCWSTIDSPDFTNLNPISDRGASRIADEMPHCSSLTSLALKYNRISSDGYKAIFSGVASSTQLKSLRLAFSEDVGSDFGSAVGLYQLKGSALTCLSFDGSRFEASGAEYITTHVVGEQLKSLDLSWTFEMVDYAKKETVVTEAAEPLRGKKVKVHLAGNCMSDALKREVDDITDGTE